MKTTEEILKATLMSGQRDFQARAITREGKLLLCLSLPGFAQGQAKVFEIKENEIKPQ